MHYADLALSFILFVLGVLSFIFRRLKTNLWITLLALVLLPAAIFSYYFPDYDRILFGKISIQDVLVYPFLKVLIILALARSIGQRRKTAKDKPTS